MAAWRRGRLDRRPATDGCVVPARIAAGMTRSLNALLDRRSGRTCRRPGAAVQAAVGGGSGGGSAGAPGGSAEWGVTSQAKAPYGTSASQPGTGGVVPMLIVVGAAPAPAPRA